MFLKEMKINQVFKNIKDFNRKVLINKYFVNISLIIEVILDIKVFRNNFKQIYDFFGYCGKKRKYNS